jgi:hypothetical protein
MEGLAGLYQFFMRQLFQEISERQGNSVSLNLLLSPFLDTTMKDFSITVLAFYEN